MKVKTLGQKDFDDACLHLGRLIHESECPDAIVGVRTGGAEVAKRAYAYLRENCPSVRHFDVSASRTSTALKKSAGVGKFFRVMPGFVLDLLRVLEHYIREFVARFNKENERNVQVDDVLKAYLGELNRGVVYVVDDAIDTGATVHALLNQFRTINVNVDYRVAVLVVTQNDPVVLPDVSLYQDILLRFPWSSDYKI